MPKVPFFSLCCRDHRDCKDDYSKFVLNQAHKINSTFILNTVKKQIRKSQNKPEDKHKRDMNTLIQRHNHKETYWVEKEKFMLLNRL